MTSNASFVSVIIPCFNGEKFLEEAVQSVLSQKHFPLEILIVDDGSSDKSAQIAQSFSEPVRTIRKIHGGLSNTLNHGLNEVKGSFIGFIDVDDRWPPGRLEWQLKIFDESPDVEIVAGTVRRFFHKPDTKVEVEVNESQRTMSIGAALFRSSVFQKVGLFDETIRCSDIDWFIRAKDQKVNMRFDDRLALLYRRHENNMTNDEQLNQTMMMTMLKRSLERKRNQKQ